MNPPDFNDMVKMIDKIQSLTYTKLRLKLELEIAEAQISKDAVVDPKYFEGGKAPSMTYIKAVYFPAGFSGELKEKRLELAQTEADLGKAQGLFDILKMQFDAWRTEQANNRNTLI